MNTDVENNPQYTPPGYYMNINPAYVSTVARRRPESSRKYHRFGWLRRLIREKLLGKKPRRRYAKKVRKFKEPELVIEMVDGMRWVFPMRSLDRANKEVDKLKAMVVNSRMPEKIYVSFRREIVLD